MQSRLFKPFWQFWQNLIYVNELDRIVWKSSEFAATSQKTKRLRLRGTILRPYLELHTIYSHNLLLLYGKEQCKNSLKSFICW